MGERMSEIPTFDTSKDGGGTKAWHDMKRYLESSREVPEPPPDITEADYPKIIDHINSQSRALQRIEIATDLDLDPAKLKPVLKYLASEGSFKELAHRYVSFDLWGRWDEAEQFRRLHER